MYTASGLFVLLSFVACIRYGEQQANSLSIGAILPSVNASHLRKKTRLLTMYMRWNKEFPGKGNRTRNKQRNSYSMVGETILPSSGGKPGSLSWSGYSNFVFFVQTAEFRIEVPPEIRPHIAPKDKPAQKLLRLLPFNCQYRHLYSPYNVHIFRMLHLGEFV